MNSIIKLSDNAASRIKEIMSGVESNSIGVRVAVKSGGCAGMSYVMEYAKEINPTDEIIEDKGVKVFVDAAAVMQPLHAVGNVAVKSKWSRILLIFNIDRKICTRMLEYIQARDSKLTYEEFVFCIN